MNPGGQAYGGQPEVDPGSMGQMDIGYSSYGEGGSAGYDGDSFEDEKPLLIELGINLDLIKEKVSMFSIPLAISAAWIQCHPSIFEIDSVGAQSYEANG